MSTKVSVAPAVGPDRGFIDRPGEGPRAASDHLTLSVVGGTQPQRGDQSGVGEDDERPLLRLLQTHAGRAEEDGDHAVRARGPADGAGGAVNMQSSHAHTLPHPSDTFSAPDDAAPPRPRRETVGPRP